MLASRCGYVCRSCRVKTELLLHHEQRRRWTDGQGKRDGENAPVAENVEEKALQGRQRRHRGKGGAAYINGRPLINKHLAAPASPIKKYLAPPLIKKHVSKLDAPDNSPFPRRQENGNGGENVPVETDGKGEGKGGLMVHFHRVPDKRRSGHGPSLQLDGLINRHVEHADVETPDRKGVGRKTGEEVITNDSFLDSLDTAVERAEAEKEAHSIQRPSVIPPRNTSSSNPLLIPAKPAKRHQSVSPPHFAWKGAAMSTFIQDARHFHGLHARMLHTSRPKRQHTEAVPVPAPETYNPFDGPPPILNTASAGGIRAQLRKWQEMHGDEEDPLPVTPHDDVVQGDAPYNDFARLPDEVRMRLQAEKDERELEQENAAAAFASSGKEGYDGSNAVEDARFLVPGDLVEIEFTRSERESILAVYVRPVGVTGNYAQFFTMQGKWLHQSERSVQYRLTGFADTATLDTIIPHLPYPESMAELNALQDKAYTEDLSVPREVAAPLVARMVKFHDDSKEVYRLHANALDDAHRILAHDTDLWYGTLATAASTLLKIPAGTLLPAAVYAVRKALVHAGFAFNMDRRSHRQTGFFQIRSKAQVKNVEQVRDWVRQWQDDLAKTAGMKKHEKQSHRPSRGATYVYSFIEKAKVIAMKSRETRQPTDSFNIGISKTRIPMTKDSDALKITQGNEFTEEEQEILRFMEAWACTNMFLGLNRIESLPPLILHATGLYPEYGLVQEVGFMFLQELGTVLPYENRVRFDQHLLLPSSQHSKPLQNLMVKLMDMRDSHNFQDSMAGLRHDWKDLPVYCIDGAGAHEIDDGISIEPAGRGADGKDQHWVHIHIANPTAFFDRQHPLAKMARHMGETIYMPERTYMMLPRWATQRHFSLAPNRPCLTFSAKMNSEGKTLEQKITPGTIRNVIALTPDEIETLIGDNSLEITHPMQTFSVGGTPPPPRARKSRLPDMQESHISQLTTLNALAQRRAGIRKSAGGLFFDSHKPDVSVWQSAKQSGLAWDHPHRKGSRTVEGDPIIQLKTRGLSNWFAPSANAVDVLVREFMLLACEISASWCAEREIPIIYRGTTLSKQSETEKARFEKEQLAPNTANDGSYPMWIGVQYLRTLGHTALRTEPIRHAFLGMEHYSKVTSPLRRYGDMILHWQIEAALRHEASTGESLLVDERKAGERRKPFMPPFSRTGLESIMLGLQPREHIVSRAQSYAETFWVAMLLFRKHYFNEDGGLQGFETRELPIGGQSEKELRMEKVPIFKAFVANRPDPHSGAPHVASFLLEFNITASMIPVEGGEEVRLGDIWECRIDRVDMFKRMIVVRAVSLVGREAL